MSWVCVCTPVDIILPHCGVFSFYFIWVLEIKHISRPVWQTLFPFEPSYWPMGIWFLFFTFLVGAGCVLLFFSLHSEVISVELPTSGSTGPLRLLPSISILPSYTCNSL